jgi:leader peptidase (prepilin peptidase)/N-methyltransferase
MLTELPYGFWATVAVALGLILGSFLNVVIHRLPRGESVVSPPSSCPGCGARIRPFDNVPVVSWLLLRGRARCCGVPISPRYPVVEAIGGLSGWASLELVLAQATGGSDLAALGLFSAYLALCLGLVAGIFIDLEFMLLPDEITLGGAALGLATTPLRHVEWTDSLLGAAVGFCIVWLPFHLGYRLLRGHPGMGLGDAKLLALSGAWFGWPGAVFALLAGAVQGTVVAGAVLLSRGRIEEPEAVRREREEMRRELEALPEEERALLLRELSNDPLATEPGEGIGKARIPFGPFLALATLEYLFFGDLLVDRYLGLVLP